MKRKPKYKRVRLTDFRYLKKLAIECINLEIGCSYVESDSDSVRYCEKLEKEIERIKKL